MLTSNRPPVGDRRFVSKAVEREVNRVSALIKDPELAWLFQNCFPNTLDTTVFMGTTNATTMPLSSPAILLRCGCVTVRRSCGLTSIWCAAMRS